MSQQMENCPTVRRESFTSLAPGGVTVAGGWILLGTPMVGCYQFMNWPLGQFRLSCLSVVGAPAAGAWVAN